MDVCTAASDLGLAESRNHHETLPMLDLLTWTGFFFVRINQSINQVKALDAAVSNSLDHWDPLQRAYSGLKEKLGEQALRHEKMLEVTIYPLHDTLHCVTSA